MFFQVTMKYKSKNFSVSLRQKEDKVLLTQHIWGNYINTKSFPTTYSVLAQNIPSIFENECFNEEGIPFSHEVKSTEIGHLFEHLILEFLKLEHLSEYGDADISGFTEWDWEKDAIGIFNIEISCSSLLYPHRTLKKSVIKAILKASAVLEEIFSSGINQEVGMTPLPDPQPGVKN